MSDPATEPRDECPKCGPDTDSAGPCAECRRKIHEGWHEAGMWWIRIEECHPNCPGQKLHPITPGKLATLGVH